MSFWSNPGASISNAVQGVVNDIKNIPQDVQTLITDPKQQIAATLANPGASALAGAALVASGVGAPLAAAIVGGTDALATGSIQKGVMSGIGAYGGANLAVDASTVGSQAAQDATVAGAAKEAGITGVNNLSDAANALKAGTITQDQYLALANGANASAGVAATTPTTTMMNGISSALTNPSAAANTIGAGSTLKGGISLAGSALEAGSGPNGNALLPSSVQSSVAATPTSGGSGITSSTYNANAVDPSKLNMIGAKYTPGENPDTSERTYFNPTFSTPDAALGLTPQQAAQLMTASTPTTKSAMGGLQTTMQSAMGNMNAPMSHNVTPNYVSSQQQMPVPQPVMNLSGGGRSVSDYVAANQAQKEIAGDAYAKGGETYNLGGYSDGGRLLRGPGDGVSDSIPATIGHKQPARLADGEFVVPARIVSELGNGSTEAGARKLYSMLDRIQHARSKTVGIGNIAKNSHADKHLPA
jgi:hypothetical protein